MKAVMISIKPKWCKLIANGKKTIEVRRTRPKLEMPFKCYIYCTKKDDMGLLSNAPLLIINKRMCNGKVIGEFVCDTFITDKTLGHDALFNAGACMSGTEAAGYSSGKKLYGWHISDLVLYDKPKTLDGFRKICQYRNDDGSCRYREVDCDCVKFDFNSDGSVNLADCLDFMVRPPQSWMYVEEICER